MVLEDAEWLTIQAADSIKIPDPVSIPNVCKKITTTRMHFFSVTYSELITNGFLNVCSFSILLFLNIRQMQKH